MTMLDQTSALRKQIGAYAAPAAGGVRAPPPAAYTDQGFFEAEREAIFLNAWYCVGRLESFAEDGDYLSLTIAGEPLLVIRGLDGVIRAFSNVCRHRLYPLVPHGAGSARRLTCPYHLWVYGLDGRLAGAPHMQATAGFDRAACALPAFRVETWLGFVFVNMNAAAEPLGPRLGEIEDLFARHDIAEAVSVAEYRRTWAGNWKLAVENASESYHHMGLHKVSIEPYMPAAGTFVGKITADWAQHRTPILADVAAEYGIRLDYPTRLAPEDRAAMKVVTIFPSMVLLSVGDLVNWLSFLPLSVDEVEVRAGFLLPPAALGAEPDPDGLRAGLQAGLEAVNGEDEQATALVQKAAASRFAARGWLSAKEGALAGFYAYLGRALAEGRP